MSLLCEDVDRADKARVAAAENLSSGFVPQVSLQARNYSPLS